VLPVLLPSYPTQQIASGSLCVEWPADAALVKEGSSTGLFFLRHCCRQFPPRTSPDGAAVDACHLRGVTLRDYMDDSLVRVKVRFDMLPKPRYSSLETTLARRTKLPAHPCGVSPSDETPRAVPPIWTWLPC